MTQHLDCPRCAAPLEIAMSEEDEKTLRDEFAMAALPRCIEVAAQFVMAEPDFEANTRNLSEVMRRAAGYAIVAADAMMEARK